MEHDDNWHEVYKEVIGKKLQADANILSSHVVYKQKNDEDGAMRLKTRIVPHGNRDIIKEKVRKNSARAQFEIISLMLTLVMLLPFRMGLVELNGA